MLQIYGHPVVREPGTELGNYRESFLPFRLTPSVSMIILAPFYKGSSCFFAGRFRGLGKGGDLASEVIGNPGVRLTRVETH